MKITEARCKKKKKEALPVLCATLDPEEVTRKTSPIVLYTCCLLWCVVLRGLVAVAAV